MHRLRNLNIYPSLFFLDQISSQLRIIRPVAWNKTEIVSQCLGVKNESDKDRENRIRQFEDFFNVSGLGTPDDLVEFREAQRGFQGRLEQTRIQTDAAFYFDFSSHLCSTVGPRQQRWSDQRNLPGLAKHRDFACGRQHKWPTPGLPARPVCAAADTGHRSHARVLICQSVERWQSTAIFDSPAA